jgi:hypothetical protein
MLYMPRNEVSITSAYISFLYHRENTGESESVYGGVRLGNPPGASETNTVWYSAAFQFLNSRDIRTAVFGCTNSSSLTRCPNTDIQTGLKGKKLRHLLSNWHSDYVSSPSLLTNSFYFYF